MSVRQALQYLTVSARKKHTATVIFAHGLGDTGHGWKDLADMFSSDPRLAHIKWVLPHAPTMPITANFGMEMPAWFDIESFDFATEDERGMLNSMHSLNQLITEQVDAGIPADRIVLGGFSQGAAMSLLTGFTTERKVGGIVVMSGWLPLRSKIKSMLSEHAKKLPIFWGHGKSDPLVKYNWAIQSVEFLRSQIGVADAKPDAPVGLEFHGYDGLTHSASDKELDDLRSWLTKVLPE